MKVQVLELRKINKILILWKEDKPFDFESYPDFIKEAIKENAEIFILDGNKYKSLEDVALYDPYHTQFSKYSDSLKKKAAMNPAVYLRREVFDELKKTIHLSINKQNDLYDIYRKGKDRLEAYNANN